MGNILKIGGLLFLASRLLGLGQRFVQSRLQYEFLGIQKGDFSIDAGSEPGNLIGRLKLRVRLTNNNPVAVTVIRTRATISQAGQRLGEIRTDDPITLKVGEPVTVAINTTITASDIVLRIANIIKDAGTIIAPIEFNGIVYLSDQTAVPISAQIQFISIS